MNLDRDLPDALRQLAGDPVADARRVLAALPGGPPSGPPTGPSTGPARTRRRKPEGPAPLLWWFLVGGLALGLGGFVLGRATAPGAAPVIAEPPVEPAKKPDQKQPDEKKPDQKPEPKVVPPPKDLGDGHLMLMAFGAFTVDEPDKGRQEITPGGWEVAAGTAFTTAQARAGIYAYPSGMQARLDEGTEATVEVDRITLTEGRVWMYTGGSKTAARIDAGPVTIQVEDAAAMVVRSREGIGVVACIGPISLRTVNGANRRLMPDQQIWFDPARGLGEVEDVPFMPSETSWMTQMILQQQDESELRERVMILVGAWEKGKHRREAALEIRKLGSRCVPMLVHGIEQRHGEVAELRKTAELIGQIVDHHGCRFAAELLVDDDAEIRVAAFRGIVRASGDDWGTDEDFWRNGEPAARAEKKKAALAALRR